jgi:hypothetical protein
MDQVTSEPSSTVREDYDGDDSNNAINFASFTWDRTLFEVSKCTSDRLGGFD